MITSASHLPSGLTVLRAGGVITASELREGAVHFVRDEPTELALWDFTKADFSALTTEDITAVFDAVVPYMSLREGGKSALLFNSTVGFGLGRMSEAIAELRDFPYEFRAFWDRYEAMDWLGLEKIP